MCCISKTSRELHKATVIKVDVKQDYATLVLITGGLCYTRRLIGTNSSCAEAERQDEELCDLTQAVSCKRFRSLNWTFNIKQPLSALSSEQLFIRFDLTKPATIRVMPKGQITGPQPPHEEIDEILQECLDRLGMPSNTLEVLSEMSDDFPEDPFWGEHHEKVCAYP
jgi:hypothetical protein